MAKPNKASEPENSTCAENGKMVLRKRTRSMKQSSLVTEEESRPRSSKKVKTNKAAKIVSKKPKKPPTAFFYFLNATFIMGRTKNETATFIMGRREYLGTNFAEALDYMIPREDFRKDFQEQNPDIKSMRDVGKACGEKWKTMTYEEKVQYYDIATEKRAAFDRAMTDYNKRMENKEEETSDEDSEFEG